MTDSQSQDPSAQPSESLLEAIAREEGDPDLFPDDVLALHAEGRQVVALIDEAHAMPAEALEEQRALVDQAVEKAGSLQFLLKQAEAAIDGLREERRMGARVRAAVSVAREDDSEGEEPIEKAA